MSTSDVLMEKDAVSEPGFQEPDVVADTVAWVEGLSVEDAEAVTAELIEARELDTFKLGGVLDRVKREKFWNPGSKGPSNESFAWWVEQVHSFSARKARYLIGVYNGIVDSETKWEKVSKIPWTKLRMIAPLLKSLDSLTGDARAKARAANDKLIKLARIHSRSGLEIKLKRLNAKESSGEHYEPVSFKLKPDQHENFEAAMKLANEMNEKPFKSDAAALDAVCTGFLTGAGKPPTLEQLLKHAGPDTAAELYEKLFPGHSINPVADEPVLNELMEQAGAESVLKAFGTLWPDVDVTATFPKDND